MELRTTRQIFFRCLGRCGRLRRGGRGQSKKVVLPLMDLARVFISDIQGKTACSILLLTSAGEQRERRGEKELFYPAVS